MKRPYNHAGMAKPGTAGFNAGAHNRMAGQAVKNPSVSNAGKGGSKGKGDKNPGSKPGKGSAARPKPNRVPGAAPIYNGPNSRDFSRTLEDEANEKNLGQQSTSTTTNTTNTTNNTTYERNVNLYNTLNFEFQI